MELEQILLTLAKYLWVPLFVSLITVKVSHYKYKTEKWWDRKADTYSKIISSLHHMKVFSDSILDYYNDGTDITKNRDKLVHEWVEAKKEINKITDFGVFIISKEAVEVLKNLQIYLNKNRHSNDYDSMDKEFRLLESSIDEIIRIGKYDLGIKDKKMNNIFGYGLDTYKS